MKKVLAWLPVAALSLFASNANAQLTLTTTLTSNNGGNVGGAVHFDLTVLNPNGVLLSQLDVNCANPRGTPAAIDVYMTAVGGTYVGNQVNPAPGLWSLRATASVVTAGNDVGAPAIFNNPIPLAPGRYGVTLVHRGCAARYTGTGTTPPTQTTFSNGDIQIDTGTAQNAPFVSGVFNPRVANVVAHYAVLAADVCSFSADVTSGTSPLIVNFTDRSVTPSGPAVAWDWDFDGDNVSDSNQQNPVFVFGSCGDYPVRLTVTAPGGPVTTTWNAHVQVDPLVADFTATPDLGPAPLSVQFPDTSSATASVWAWDFDGDAVTDSTLQNPSHTFGPGAHEVSLTVVNGCRAEVVKKRITVASDTFDTGGAPNSFVNLYSVAFFDLAVTATEALSVCAIDFNSYTPAGNPMLVDVYLTDTTYNGKITTPAVWRKVASATGVTPGAGVPAQLVLDRPILLLPGRSYGVGLHHIDNASYYVNLSAPIANSDLTLTPGAVAYSPNGPFTNASPFSIRQWVGRLHYNRRGTAPQGVTTWFGRGCPGPLGVPTLTPAGTDRPTLGSTTSFLFDGLPQSAAFLLLGFSDQQGPLGPLPQDLGLFGAPGCNVHVSPDFSNVLIGANNQASWSFSAPNNPAFAGVLFFVQGLALSPGSNVLGGVTTDATALMLGAF